jgi:hypothetical protein
MNTLAEHDRRSDSAEHDAVLDGKSRGGRIGAAPASGKLTARCRRGLMRGWIAAVGLIAIGGCGGSSDPPPQCSFFSNVCNPTVGPFTALPVASIYPNRITAQAGTPVVFTVDLVGLDHPAYRWLRSSDGGRTYAEIAGATSATYTLSPAQLADDGTLFRVEVQGNGAVASALSRLAVSSAPGIVFQDGEFLPADWLTADIAMPPQNGPTHSEERVITGGHPDAFRRMVHTTSPGPSALSVRHTLQSATYDPAAMGAIYVIDYTEDCIGVDAHASGVLVDSNLLLEQGARKYALAWPVYCTSLYWAAMEPRTGLTAQEFVLIDGPTCSAGESCPDFSASAQPLRFGFVRGTKVLAGVGAGSIVHRIDNWKVTVWRR